MRFSTVTYASCCLLAGFAFHARICPLSFVSCPWPCRLATPWSSAGAGEGRSLPTAHRTSTMFSTSNIFIAIVVTVASCLAFACGFFAGRARAARGEQRPPPEATAASPRPQLPQPTPEALVALPRPNGGGGADSPRPSASPRRRRTTPVAEDAALERCVILRHQTRTVRNEVSVYLMCLQCRKHALWRYYDTPNFAERPALAFMESTWQKLRGPRALTLG